MSENFSSKTNSVLESNRNSVSDFSSKKQTFLSFVFVFGIILFFGYAVGEALVWLAVLILTAVN